MRLTKTQAAILATLERKGRFGAAWSHGHGADGGKVNYGSREWLAALALVRMGLARDLGRNHFRQYKNGWCVHTADIAIGRKEETNE